VGFGDMKVEAQRGQVYFNCQAGIDEESLVAQKQGKMALLNLAMKRFLKALWLCPQSNEIIARFSNAAKSSTWHR
jgi:hypothetical protein